MSSTFIGSGAPRPKPRLHARSRLLFAMAVLAVLSPRLAASQQPDEDSGLWWAAGVGAGALHFTCDYCAATRDVGPSVQFALGAYARPDLGVGVEVGGWSNDDDGVRESLYTASTVAQLYPRPGSGFHLQGGLGWAGYRAETFAYDAVHLSLGVGWDLPLTGRWVVGNGVSLDAASFGTLRNEGRAAVRDVSLSVVRFTVLLKRR